MNCSMPGLPVHHQLPEFTQTSHPSSQWCHPAISSSVVPFSSCPPIPPIIRVFSNESTLRMRWPKYWSFSFSIIPSKEIPGLISFRMDWLIVYNINKERKEFQRLLQRHHNCYKWIGLIANIWNWYMIQKIRELKSTGQNRGKKLQK